MAARKSEPKVMDVSKPGKTAPSQTGRPTITGHGPMAKDPTVVDTAPKDETADPISESANEAAGSLTAATRKKIVPISDDVKPEADAETVKPAEPEAASGKKPEPADEPAADSLAEPADEETETAEKPADADAAGGASESGAVDAVAEQAQAKKQADKDAEAAIAKQQETQKLIENKKYFVPIGHDSTKKGGSRKALIVLVVLIVVAAGAYLAADAGVVKVNGFEVPYHIIGNK